MSAAPKQTSRSNGLEGRAETRALELLGKGRPSIEAMAEILGMGLSHSVARRIVADAEEFIASDRRSRAFRGVILGAAVLVAGGGVIYATKAFDVGTPYNLIGYAILAYGVFSLLINAWAFQYPAQ